MKNIFTIILISIMLVLSGCAVSFDPVSLIKSNPQVQSFMDEYPNAEVLVTHYGVNESSQLIEEIAENCEKLIEPKDMYRFYVKDRESDLEILGYIDSVSQVVECIKKYAPEDTKSNKEKLDEKKYEKEEYEYEHDEWEEENYIELYGDEHGENIILEWEIEHVWNIDYFKVYYENKEGHEDIVEKVEAQDDVFEYRYEVEKDLDAEGFFIYAVTNEGDLIESNFFELHHNEEHEDEWEEIEFEVEGENEEHEIFIEWEVSSTDNIKYFKVVRSYDNEHPKYPEDETVLVLDESDFKGEEEFEYEFYEKEEGEVYYSVSIVFENGEIVHGEPLEFFIESEEEYEYEELQIEIDGDYDYEDYNLEIKVELEGNLEKIEYVKVIRSYDNEEPSYPENDLVKYVEHPDEFDYEFNIEEDDMGPFYYRALLVTYDDEKIYSDVLEFEIEEHNETETNSTS